MVDLKFAEGSASIDPNAPVQAGSTGFWTITLRVEGDAISPGSAILISIPQSFTPPQIDNPKAPDMCARRPFTLKPAWFPESKPNLKMDLICIEGTTTVQEFSFWWSAHRSSPQTG